MSWQGRHIRVLCCDEMKRRIRLRSGVGGEVFSNLYHRAYLDYPEVHPKSVSVGWWR